jgi:glutamate-1-semialdehyde 2,1-aminomutase
MNETHARLGDLVYKTYVERTKKSLICHEQALHYLPGGDTRSTVYFSPYPVYMVRGEGCYLYDCDGNQYVDFLGNYTSLVHGHRNPAILRAIKQQLEKGTIFGAPSEIQFSHARHLCDRVPSMELLRYCNSGTEATMMALRAARAFTRRDLIVKIDGGYHGSHDAVEVNGIPDLVSTGASKGCVPRGVPECILSAVLVAPFNDMDAMANLIAQNRDRIAAVIIEPIMGAAGLINPEPGYLEEVRSITKKSNIVLIFDEIQTFRLKYGGMQELLGVIPDMTTLGKMIGGGMPVGAFGGRMDIMGVFDPSKTHSLSHGGTFNGSDIVLAAGLAALQILDQKAIDRINYLGQRLRDGFLESFKATGVRGCISGWGSLLKVHWGEKMPRNAREAFTCTANAETLFRLLHLEMTNRGFYTAKRGSYAVSTPMTEKEIDRCVEAFCETLELIKPCIGTC